MDPITLGVIGVAVYGWLRSQPPSVASGHPSTPLGQQLAATPAAATAGNQPISSIPAGAFATPTSTANAPVAPLANAAAALPIPSDGLITALDNDTAIALRDYAVLNPDDFQIFLDRYADRLELRDDLFVKALQPPPPGGYQPTPGMVAGMGLAAYKVAQGLNGVAAGNYGDLFGVTATAAGQIPGMDPMALKAIQGLALAYRGFTAGTLAMSDIAALAAANGVSVIDMTAALFGIGESAGALTAGLAAPIASLSGVLMVVGLVVDIGFTIAGNAPDIQKAIDTALDVASLACLFIPVVGWVVAIVIQVVKFLIDLFGGDLFGGGLSHAQREAIETARYGQNLNPMFPEIANAYTPRELHRSICNWTTGYCGGVHVIAMGVNLILKEGDVVSVGGTAYTVTSALGTGAPILLPPGATQIALGIVDNGAGGHGCYALKGSPFEAMTNDEIAWALAKYGSTNGVVAEAQAGIAESMKGQFNLPVQNLVEARAAPMLTFLDHGFSLDQIDQVALEYRAQPHLNALAAAFGFPDWQHLLGDVLAVEWLVFNWTNSHGSLGDFARKNGYPSMYAFRAAALASYEAYYAGMVGGIAAIQAAQVAAASTIPVYNSAILFLQSSGSSAP